MQLGCWTENLRCRERGRGKFLANSTRAVIGRAGKLRRVFIKKKKKKKGMEEENAPLEGVQRKKIRAYSWQYILRIGTVGGSEWGLGPAIAHDPWDGGGGMGPHHHTPETSNSGRGVTLPRGMFIDIGGHWKLFFGVPSAPLQIAGG